MAIDVSISPHGSLVIEALPAEGTAAAADPVAKRVLAAFAGGQPAGLLHLATVELQSALPPALGFARDLARLYLTRLCQTPGEGDGADGRQVPEVPAPAADELSSLAMQAPLMKGLEYLDAAALGRWWAELDGLVREQVRTHAGG